MRLDFGHIYRGILSGEGLFFQKTDNTHFSHLEGRARFRDRVVVVYQVIK